MRISKSVINSVAYLFFISVGILTILYQIHFDDLWFDEMNSFYVADPSLTFNETKLRHNESDWHNPILFNFILKCYLNLVGYDPLLARYVPFIFGSLSLFMFGLISYQVKKDNSFLLTTLLACLSIYIIKYSQELRPYSLLLFLSVLNIFFYIRLLNNSSRKVLNSLFFIVFSVLNYSTHPFGLIILFSQIVYSFCNYLLNKKTLKFFLFLYLVIIIFYLFFNYNYILFQISFENYMLSHDIKNIFDGFYFPRFFGSKIMGYFYLFLLTFLICKNYKLIFIKKNSYLFFFILIIFSYIIPLVYGILKTPVLQDRYIIFILIPVLILISCLINELSHKRIKNILILFTVLLTLSNHYVEIFERLKTKPEFSKILKDVQKSKIRNVVLLIETDPSYLVGANLVFNYLKNINFEINNNLTFYKYNMIPKDLKNFWLVCYKPNLDYDCKIEHDTYYKHLKTKKYLQVDASLYISK